MQNKENMNLPYQATIQLAQNLLYVNSSSQQSSFSSQSTLQPNYDEESSNSNRFTDFDAFSSIYSQSAVSLDEEVMEQQYQWLAHSISKTCNRLLWGAFASGDYSAFDSHQIQHEDSLVDYLRKYKSLIPKTMVAGFLSFLAQVPHFQDLLEWIYGHVQPRFGDELILIAFKVVVAYLPIKQIVLTREQISSIPLLPFNVCNIYNDPSLRILHFSSFCKQINGSGQPDPDLYHFCAAYMETLLLVLEGYSQNPYYKQIQQQEEGRQDGSMNRPWNKKKKITKRK